MSAEIRAVRCEGCGGSVAASPGSPVPACLFCGATVLTEFAPGADIVEPDRALPFDLDEAAAQAAFKAFARSSFWYPSDLAGAGVALRRVFVPAWAFSGRVETTWAGLAPASTRSGKRPLTGAAETRFAQVVVPASAGLQPAELRALGAWDESRAAPFHPDDAPYELSTRTRDGLAQAAQDECGARHRASLKTEHGLLSIRGSHVAHDLDGRPFLLPIWIGAYRYRELPYRVVIHGQTGATVGTAPWSRWKLFLAVVLPIAALAAAAVAATGCAGFGALLGR